MPKAECIRCGAVFYGWALKYKPDPWCAKCGGSLVLLANNDVPTGMGLSDSPEAVTKSTFDYISPHHIPNLS
jgi:NAD-dependent SIR2 family protein deacetylase